MDYYFAITIIVHGEFDDPIPWLWDVWFFGGGEFISTVLIASGTGTFTASGEAGNVKIIMFATLVDGVMEWPIETISFY